MSCYLKLHGISRSTVICSRQTLCMALQAPSPLTTSMRLSLRSWLMRLSLALIPVTQLSAKDTDASARMRVECRRLAIITGCNSDGPGDAQLTQRAVRVLHYMHAKHATPPQPSHVYCHPHDSPCTR